MRINQKIRWFIARATMTIGVGVIAPTGAGAVVVGCSAEPAPGPGLAAAVEDLSAPTASPVQSPSLVWDVSLVNGVTLPTTAGSGHYTRPYIPSFRTTSDGRVAVNLKAYDNGPVGFFLLAPEKLAHAGAPFTRTVPGVEILASTAPFTLDPRNLHGTSKFDLSLGNHLTICDATPQFPNANTAARTNPYACGTNSEDDCYDVRTIAGFQESLPGGSAGDLELWATPITIEISKPKTAAAQIVAVRPNAAYGTAYRPRLLMTRPWNAFLEPMVTEDGKLMIFRGVGKGLDWPGAPPGTDSRSFNIVYMSATGDACDFTDATVYPLAHAPHDSSLKGKYGIAEYPFRDTEGNETPDAVDIKGTYPWMDRKGNNAFFMTVAAKLFFEAPGGTIRARYPSSCVSGVKCLPIPQTVDDLATVQGSGNVMGVSMAGLWTHGKLVLLDGVLNNTDYALPVPDPVQRVLDLYGPMPDDHGGTKGVRSVRVGSGRSDFRTEAPAGSPLNTTFLDSIENLFNYHEYMRPTTLRDVVWIMNTGRGSSEVAFDDFIDPNALVVSDMTASLTFDNALMPSAYRYNDGFHQTSDTAGAGFVDPIHVQNSATSLARQWNVPAFGSVVGNARIEPIALGGIHGKGLWLDGASGLAYAVSRSQPTPVRSVGWFVGVFVDSRFDDARARRLFTFPDDTFVEVRGRRAVRYVAGGSTVHAFSLPQALTLAYQGWSHVGLWIRPRGSGADFYVNGELVDTYDAGEPLFEFAPSGGAASGKFTVGSPRPTTAGVVGWVDELKVLAGERDLETICNHARGTIVGLPDKYIGPLLSVAQASARAWRVAIDATLSANGVASQPNYACFTDYTTEQGAYLDGIPAGTVSERSSLHFPEGPLHAGSPRPDSRKNPFCLTCHSSEQARGLLLSALTFEATVPMEDDERRQPTQPLRLVFGNVPADFVGASPPDHRSAPRLGLELDRWVFP